MSGGNVAEPMVRQTDPEWLVSLGYTVLNCPPRMLRVKLGL